MHNGPEGTAAGATLKDGFGVEWVNVVGYGKGGLDTRQHVRTNNDVDVLVMIASRPAP